MSNAVVDRKIKKGGWAIQGGNGFGPGVLFGLENGLFQTWAVEFDGKKLTIS